jgi:hypothetical protein
MGSLAKTGEFNCEFQLELEKSGPCEEFIYEQTKGKTSLDTVPSKKS